MFSSGVLADELLPTPDPTFAVAAVNASSTSANRYQYGLDRQNEQESHLSGGIHGCRQQKRWG